MNRALVPIAMLALSVTFGTCATGAGPPHLPASAAPAPRADIDVTLFLIGDAGAPAAPPASEPVLLALQTAAAGSPSPVVIFLGDNVYPHGLPDSGSLNRAEAERRLRQQLRVAQLSGATAIFLPGNHDSDGADDRRAAVSRAEAFVAAAGTRAVQLPAGGCPGPAVRDFNSTLRVVALNTQWWLQDRPKSWPREVTCPENSPAEVVTALQSALRDGGGRVVVVAGHHPLRTNGPHGGHFRWDAHVFPLRAVKSWLWLPLPVVGSLYPIARRNGVSNQDISNGMNRRMRAAFDSVLLAARPRPLVYASGHEHGLQVIAGSSARYLLVSGGGTFGHVSPIAALDSTRFARSASGFMRLDILRDRRARLAVIVVDAAGIGTEAYSLWLQ